MKRIKKILTSATAVILGFGLLLCSAPYAEVTHASKVSQLEDKYKDLENQLKKAKNDLEKIKKQASGYIEQRKNYENQMSLVNNQIDLVESEITQLESEVVRLEKDVEAKRISVEDLSVQIDKQYEQFKERLKAFHLRDNASTLEMLLNADSFKDFLTKYEVMRAIAEHDEELMNSLENDKKMIDGQKTELQDRIDELENQKKSLEDKKKKLADKNKDLKSLSKEAESALKKARDQETEKQKLIDYIDESLDKLEKEIDEATKASQKTEYVGGDFIWPCPAYTRISSPFGYRTHPVTGKYKLHKGVDLAAPRGSDILASNSGSVTAAYKYENGSYGKYIIINHGGGRVTLYAHCDKVLVSKGDTVKKGDVIAKVGSTGTATGNHLHFEIRVNGEYKNPMSYFKKA